MGFLICCHFLHADMNGDGQLDIYEVEALFRREVKI